MTIAIRSETGHLTIEPKGERKLEAFVKQVDATLVFAVGADNEAKGAFLRNLTYTILHLNCVMV